MHMTKAGIISNRNRPKKRSPQGVLKRMSIGELEILNKTDAEELKSAIEEVLLAKKILRKVQEKYRSL